MLKEGGRGIKSGVGGPCAPRTTFERRPAGSRRILRVRGENCGFLGDPAGSRRMLRVRGESCGWPPGGSHQGDLVGSTRRPALRPGALLAWQPARGWSRPGAFHQGVPGGSLEGPRVAWWIPPAPAPQGTGCLATCAGVQMWSRTKIRKPPGGAPGVAGRSHQAPSGPSRKNAVFHLGPFL